MFLRFSLLWKSLNLLITMCDEVKMCYCQCFYCFQFSHDVSPWFLHPSPVLKWQAPQKSLKCLETKEKINFMCLYVYFISVTLKKVFQISYRTFLHLLRKQYRYRLHPLHHWYSNKILNIQTIHSTKNRRKTFVVATFSTINQNCCDRKSNKNVFLLHNSIEKEIKSWNCL